MSVTGGTELHSRHELLEVFGLELHRPRSAEEARRLSQEARQELDAFLAKERRSSLRASSSAVRALALAVTIQLVQVCKSGTSRLYHFWLYQLWLYQFGCASVLKSVLDAAYRSVECFRYFLVVRNKLSVLSEVSSRVTDGFYRHSRNSRTWTRRVE